MNAKVRVPTKKVKVRVPRKKMKARVPTKKVKVRVPRKKAKARVRRKNFGWLLFGSVIIIILVANTYLAISEIFYPIRPTVGVASAFTYVVSADAQSVLFVYPDYNTSHPKLAGVRHPTANDFALYSEAIGVILATAKNSQIETIDTGTYIDAGNGIPKADFKGSIVLLGGSDINAAVKGYENLAATPIILDNSDKTYYYFKNNTGSRLESSAMPKSNSANNATDVFVIQAFRDMYNRPVFIMYGYSPMGTLAAAKYYKTFVLPDLASYTASYYVVKWADAAAGPSHNGFPDPGDTYTVMARGQPRALTSTAGIPLYYIGYVYVSALILILVGVAVGRRWIEFVIEKAS